MSRENKWDEWIGTGDSTTSKLVRATWFALTPERMPDAQIPRSNEMWRAIDELPALNLRAIAVELAGRLPDALSDKRKFIDPLVIQALQIPAYPDGETPREHARYRDTAGRYLALRSLDNALQLIARPMVIAAKVIEPSLPPAVDGGTKVPIIDLIPDIPAAVEKVMLAFFAPQIREYGLFRKMRETLLENATNEKGVKTKPTQSKLEPREVPQAYLKNTPLLQLFTAQVPFGIPLDLYRRHGIMFAPTGHGKTHFFNHTIASLLHLDDPPGMFVFDSQDDIVEPLTRLAVFNGPLKDRIIILAPPEPALNFFALGDIADAETKELAEYLFASIDRSLTGKQGGMVSYLLQLIKMMPNATLETLAHILAEPIRKRGWLDSVYYADYLSKTTGMTRLFFETIFYDKAEMGATRKQVASRISDVLSQKDFGAMFSSTENKFDAAKAMDERKIVLISTSQSKLGLTGSAVFGRFMLAQIMRAAKQRDPLKKHPLSIIFVDEAHDYFDHTTKRILLQARKRYVGMMSATIMPEDIDASVLAALKQTTAIKFAGPNATFLADEMYCEPSFIKSMTQVGQFACHLAGMNKAVKLTVPADTLVKMPTMSEADYQAMRARNRELVGSAKTAKKPPSQSPTSGPTVKWND